MYPRTRVFHVICTVHLHISSRFIENSRIPELHIWIFGYSDISIFGHLDICFGHLHIWTFIGVSFIGFSRD